MSIVPYISGWTVRIYHDFPAAEESANEELVCNFQALAHVDICNSSRVLNDRNVTLDAAAAVANARLLPLVDPTVDYFMSRDSHSAVLDREVAAVDEWMHSPSTFHIIRDHPSHCTRIFPGNWVEQRKQPQLLFLVYCLYFNDII